MGLMEERQAAIDRLKDDADAEQRAQLVAPSLFVSLSLLRALSLTLSLFLAHTHAAQLSLYLSLSQTNTHTLTHRR